jgi:hypothetical protein
MITQALTSSFKKELLQGVHDLDNDVFKVALYLASANIDSTTTVYTTTGESSGTGYTAGGQTLVNLGASLSGTIAYASWEDAEWPNTLISAAGALVYNSSKGNKSVAVLNFGGTYTWDGSKPVKVTFPANTSTTAVIIIN